MPPVAASISISIDSLRSLPTARRQAAGDRGRAAQVGLVGDPGEAERGQVDDGVDPFVGELGGPQRAFGTQVERRVGQDHGGSPRNVQRVDDQVAGPSVGALVLGRRSEIGRADARCASSRADQAGSTWLERVAASS